MTALTRFNGGLTPFRSFFSNFFEGEMPGFDLLYNKNEMGLMPAVNISENDKYFEIELAVPGMHKNDFKVKVEDKVLKISAETKEEKEEKKKDYLRREFRYNSFERSFTLPENAKEEDIKAHYEDGVLKLSIMKRAVAVSKTKEIAIV